MNVIIVATDGITVKNFFLSESSLVENSEVGFSYILSNNGERFYISDYAYADFKMLG